MPAASPGMSQTSSQTFPGTPAVCLQSLSSFTYRQSRYIAYLAGSQLNILSSPNTLVQAVPFKSTLLSVIAESDNGRLVVATRDEVFVLKPEIEGWSRVWWETSLLLKREDAGDTAQWLCWGDDGEVLVGGTHALSLFSSLPSSRVSSSANVALCGDRVETRHPMWAIPVASPVLFAEFSPSATLIATCASYDRLVKIWRRLSFEEGLFDYTYLPHPAIVTHISWRPLEDGLEERRSSGLSWRHDENPEVLYTLAVDGVLRIWRTGGTHDSDILKLFTAINLVSAIPQSPSLSSSATITPRYMFFIPSNQFSAAVNASIGLPQSNEASHSIEHLKEIASQTPDIIVTLDGQGHMSAWGIQSIGHKRRSQEARFDQPYHIAHAEGLPIKLMKGVPMMFTNWFQHDRLQLLCHEISKHGSITWWEGGIETFMSPSATGSERLQLRGKWCGHDRRIDGIQSTPNSVVTRADRDAARWVVSSSGVWDCVTRVTAQSTIIDATFLERCDMLLTVHASEYAIWDKEGRQIAVAAHATDRGAGVIHVTESNAKMVTGFFVQTVPGPLTQWTVRRWADTIDSKCSLEVNGGEKSERLAEHFILPLRSTTPTKTLDIASISRDGLYRKVLNADGIHSLPQDAVKFATGVDHISAFAASDSIIALAASQSKELRVLNANDSYVEFKQQTDEEVSSLVIYNGEEDIPIIAVGYAHKIEILVRGQYAPSSSDFSSWMIAKTISIANKGLKIEDLAWASRFQLAFTAGNNLFFVNTDVISAELPQDSQERIRAATSEAAAVDLHHTAHLLQATLPQWSPLYLSTLLRRGDFHFVADILIELATKLKFWSSGDELRLDIKETFVTQAHRKPTSTLVLSEDVFDDLRDLLAEKELPHITRAEQQDLQTFINTMAYLRQHVNALDRNAVHFLFEWKWQLQRSNPDNSAESTSSSPPPPQPPVIDWQTIATVHQSNTQQPLLDILVLHYDNKLTWPIVRNLGLLSWLTDHATLGQVVEQVAQSAYKSQQPADPIDASLYFLALRKKPTLVSLWRIATWHKEQKSTLNFLKRDFSQADARTAARKNAYALMGKRRFEYSATFFLLADDPQSAVNALAGQCEDIALAIAVARLYCGDGSDVLKQLIESRLLPMAQQEGNRWLSSWCHSVLNQRKEAADVLVAPLSTGQSKKRWQQDHPDVMTLYKQVRSTPSDYEYQAVLRSARVLQRMGLWSLSLGLVAGWEFARPSTVAATSHGQNLGANGVDDHIKSPEATAASVAVPTSATDSSSLLDAFSQPPNAIVSAEDDQAARKAKAAELLLKLKAKKDKVVPPSDVVKKPPPTQFKEPEANSLLDSFGF
jgi:hypothetical protein